ncbi:polysaccharide pyruvyl transferase family protein [Bacillus dakarensis]|uniref:polysaccharide pyruvyl transferase family protein n=1 Tax=Robertmurraya dakarensis TaxID=1926278 RepID=UPI0009818364|nr:polysaccharide pyruvyl transferase family protein [Bacillus dakarensis]
MKIGIIGNYGHDNNGDEAILQGILTQLVDELGINSDDIVIFSNNPDNTKSRYGLQTVKLLHKRGSLLKSMMATIAHNRKIISGLNLLIIGGGGLLMDMYKRDAPLYSSHAMLGRLTGCKVIIYGVGAGPITTKPGTFLIKKMISSAESVSVRDTKSKELLESIGVTKPVHVIADPAFQLGKQVDRQPTSSVKNIGVTAVPYFSKDYWPTSDEAIYRNYVNGMAANLDVLIEKHGVNVTFFSTKFPQDVKVTEEIFEVMKHRDHVTILKDNLHPPELVSICQKQDILIGTRLHSLILAVAAKTPVIGIGYHQKVKDFLKKIDREQGFVDIQDLHEHPHLLDAIVEKYKENWMREQEEIAAISMQQQEEAEAGIQQIRQALMLGGKYES